MGQTQWGTLEDMVLGLSEGLRLPGDTGQVHTHSAQRATGSHCDPGWSVCREGQRGRTSARDRLEWGNFVQEVPLAQVNIPGGYLLPGAAFQCSQPCSCPQALGPRASPDKKISLYLSTAFNTPGSKLQAVDDDPGLAAGNSELHEDTTVSFQPGSEQERAQPGHWRGDRKPGGMSVPSWSANAL